MKRREIFPSAGSAAEGGKFLPLLLSHLLTSGVNQNLGLACNAKYITVNQCHLHGEKILGAVLALTTTTVF